ncbi:SwmB domain-containing protein, partial [Verminephrobacter aporrectodeae]|uniref:SwmB domain-containing protein n=1 Tax=Verminephrobacter aporrectodeae TaxID=1110389 RepID=UPI00023773E2
ASIPTTVIKNNAPDRTPPQLITTGDARPKVNGNQLVLSFSDASNLNADPTRKPVAGDFAVLVGNVPNAVTEVTVAAQAKTITLTLTTAVTVGQTMTVAYNDSTPTDSRALEDALLNRLASFAATEVNTSGVSTSDTTPPVINTAVVTGDQLVLTYTEAGTLDAAALTGNAGFTVNTAAGTAAITVSSAVVNATAKTVTLTLSRTVAETETVTVSYTKPESGNGVRDAAGNHAANFNGVIPTHGTLAPADTTPPVFSSAAVTGDQLVLSFSDTGNLDGDPVHKPASGAFTVLVNGVANAVTTVTVQSRAKTVTLTLSTAVTHGQSVTVAYTDPTTGNDTNAIQDAAGNDAASFAATAVTNNT